MFDAWAKRMVERINGSPVARRFAAFVIDYLLCGFVAMIPSIVAYSLLVGGTMTDLSGFVDAGYGVGLVTVLALLSLAVSFCYHVIVPWRVWPGQTVGKRQNGLEVVMMDGSTASLATLAIRWATMTFVETLMTVCASFVIQLVNIVCGPTVGTAYTVFGMVVSLFALSRVLWGKLRRPPHDVLAGTWVYTG